MTLLSEKEAFQAMIAFLTEVWERTSSDELGALLGSMSFLPDGKPADEALWADWQKCVQRAKAGAIDSDLGLQ